MRGAAYVSEDGAKRDADGAGVVLQLQWGLHHKTKREFKFEEERLTKEFIDLRGEVDAATVNTERHDIFEMSRR